MRLRRGDQLPDDVRAALVLTPGERVLSFGRTRSGGWVVASDRALLTGAERISWTAVAHAQWYDEEQVLAVDRLPGQGDRVRLELSTPGHLPETVHERVMASIVLSRRVAVPGGAVRVAGRRGSGSEETEWQVVADEGTNLADPAVRAAVDAVLAALQDELG